MEKSEIKDSCYWSTHNSDRICCGWVTDGGF
jgi:hypothetical protein